VSIGLTLKSEPASSPKGFSSIAEISRTAETMKTKKK
jgi:hypothetical protein